MSAVEIFEEKGFHNTRIIDITNKAGTSVGNFYRYFNSKEEVLEVVINEFYNLMLNRLQKLNDYDIPPIPVIKQLIRDYLKMFKEKKEIALIFIEQMSGIDKKYSELRNDYVDKFSQEVEKIIKRLVELKVARQQDPIITANVWSATLLHIFHWWILLDFKMDVEKIVDNVTKFLVSGTMSKEF
ncbi:MAG: TetR/AcrR family transcriptional regulator [Candidatus Hermodarchaeota archaeon]